MANRGERTVRYALNLQSERANFFPLLRLCECSRPTLYIKYYVFTDSSLLLVLKVHMKHIRRPGVAANVPGKKRDERSHQPCQKKVRGKWKKHEENPPPFLSQAVFHRLLLQTLSSPYASVSHGSSIPPFPIHARQWKKKKVQSGVKIEYEKSLGTLGNSSLRVFPYLANKSRNREKLISST